MNFLNWMNMNMIIDIACIVFFGAIIWKFRKNKTNSLVIEKNMEMQRLAIIQLIEKSDNLEEKINLVAKNPQAARRRLKQNK